MNRLFIRFLSFSMILLFDCIYVSNTVNAQTNNNFITDTIFYRNKNIKTIRKYNSDMSVMYAQLFDKDSRRLISEGRYIDKQRDSLWNSYDRKGRLLITTIYKNGKKEGTEYSYYPNGNIAELTEWKDDKKNGVAKTFYPNKILKIDVTYINNLKNGKATFYFPSGKISLQGDYKNGKRNGEWIYYNEAGNIQKVESYNNGFILKLKK